MHPTLNLKIYKLSKVAIITLGTQVKAKFWDALGRLTLHGTTHVIRFCQRLFG
jgi:hypothetical protein